MNKYVKSDLVRYGAKPTSVGFIREYFCNKTFRWQVAFRLVNSSGVEKIVGALLWKLNRNRQSIQIHRKTSVGYGLYIGHNGPVVVNPTAVIGNNVNLSQFTTIGAIDGNAAVVGDNVYIGPNCCLVENVHIGDSATIGAGSVVTKDIPANATAVGNYAKVISFDNPGRYVRNRWNDQRG